MSLRTQLLTPFLIALLLGVLPLTAASTGRVDDTPKEPVVEVPIHPNTTCPIMGKAISTRLFVDTDKGRFWVCCKACYEEILAELDLAHQTAYPEVEKLELKTCPVTGEPLPEKPHRIVVQGFDVPLCCEPCAPKFLADSQIHLALLANPKLVDLRNPRCPITDEPVTANSYCTIDGVLVRLSSPRMVDDVKKDAAAALAAAKVSVEKHGALPHPRCPIREKEEKEAAESTGNGL